MGAEKKKKNPIVCHLFKKKNNLNNLHIWENKNNNNITKHTTSYFPQ